MRAPYGLNIIDNCLNCRVREEHLFCNLPLPALQKLNEIKSTAIYPKSAMLFIEGQLPRGIFVLCTGKAKLSTSSSEGKTVILKISEPGDVIGRDALLHFLREHGEVALRVAEQLSHNYYSAYEEVRTLGLATSPSEKFAKLLLSWSANAAHSTDASHIKLTLTHEEIAEMIGTSRETVSRLFSEFKRKQLLQMKGIHTDRSQQTRPGENGAHLSAWQRTHPTNSQRVEQSVVVRLAVTEAQYTG